LFLANAVLKFPVRIITNNTFSELKKLDAAIVAVQRPSLPAEYGMQRDDPSAVGITAAPVELSRTASSFLYDRWFVAPAARGGCDQRSWKP